jgi:tetratricopeptide (TPR) repeat protein
MELREERELKQIRETFTRGIDLFRQRQYKEALAVFTEIVQEYEDSEYYSILEIEGRSKVYKKICEAQLFPVKIELRDDEDYLFDGIYQLNTGNLDKALERFNYLKEKNYQDPYLIYLLSLVYLKKEDTETCFKYLKQAIDQEEYYKVIAYNEPDFDPLFDNQRYAALTEIREDE